MSATFFILSFCDASPISSHKYVQHLQLCLGETGITYSTCSTLFVMTFTVGILIRTKPEVGKVLLPHFCIRYVYYWGGFCLFVCFKLCIFVTDSSFLNIGDVWALYIGVHGVLVFHCFLISCSRGHICSPQCCAHLHSHGHTGLRSCAEDGKPRI